MRTYTFKRECGHTVRGIRRAKSLARPCTDCILRILLEGKSLPKGFHLWSESLQTQWVKDTLTTCQTLNNQQEETSHHGWKS